MISFVEHLSGPAWQNLALTLLHTLWQGALLALLLYVALRWISARRQNLRYALSLGALGVTLLSGLVTWSVLSVDGPQESELNPSAVAALSSAPDSSTADSSASSPSEAIDWAAVSNAPVSPGERESVERESSTEGRPKGAAAPRVDFSAWTPALVVCWLAGVALMLVRVVASVAGARRLARSPKLADPLVLGLVEELRERLRIARRVRVVVCEALSSPAVLGAIWPTLLLPASMMTGLTPDQWRAILAHELAHIRRHDYLINVAVMLIEAVLFFNPALWWITRRVRAEREACCDSLAVSVTGEPLSYAETLAGWVERCREAGPPLAAVAMTSGTERGTLLDRIRRILVPGYQPKLRVSWSGLAALLLSGVVLLAGLWRGTTAVVALAAEILSPAERIEKLEQVQREYGDPIPADGPKGKVTVSGRLRTFDGKPLPDKIWAYYHSKRTGSTSSGTLGQTGRTFSYAIPGGIVYLRIEAEGYAPLSEGPLRPDDGLIEGLDLVLRPGFRGRVRVVGPEGRPVAGTILTGGVAIGDVRIGGSHEWEAGRDGIAVIEHASERPYRFHIRMPGFQRKSHKVRLKPDEAVTLKLARARPVTGVLVPAEGESIGGATVRLLQEYRFRENHTHQYGERGPVLATADDSGRFTIDTLNDDSIYALWIETERHGPKIVEEIEAGQTDLTIELGPNLSLNAKITGDLGKLRFARGKPYAEVRQRYDIRNHGGLTFQRVDVEIADETGRFYARNLLPGEVEIRVGDRTVRTEVRKPDEKITIDLDEKKPAAKPRPEAAPTRTVVLRFVPPNGGPPPTGTVYVSAARPQRLELKDGRVSVEVEPPRRVYYRPEDLVGYWFKDDSLEVKPGEEPAEFDIPLVSAGAIYGRVLNPDGTPASERVGIGSVTVSKPPGLEKMGSLNRLNVRVDAEGRFFVTPVPLGGTWRVKAARGKNVQFSEPVEVNEAQPAPRVTVRMVEPVACEGTVLDPEGRPVPRLPVTLRLAHPSGAQSWSPEPTDRKGRFRFEINPAAGDYRVELKPRKDYVPTTQRLKTDGGPTVIRLERGEVLEGTVLDAATGRPIPGVEVYAMPAERREGDPPFLDAEAPTDDDGRFRFSTLGERRPYKIHARGLNEQNWRDNERVIPREGEAAIIRGTLPERSRLKPVAPRNNNADRPAAKPDRGEQARDSDTKIRGQGQED